MATNVYKRLVPQFGCKAKQAPVLNEHYGDHQVWWDVCSASLAPLFGKERCRQEVVNDLHQGVINLARVVQDDKLSLQLYDRLMRTAFCEDLYANSCSWLEYNEQERNSSLNVTQAMPVLEWAYNYLVSSWMGRNGLAGTTRENASGFCKRFTSNGGDPATRWMAVVESVPWWWNRLRGVTILNENAFDLLARIEDKKGTVIYIDPPYFGKNGSYLYDFKKVDPKGLTQEERLYGCHGTLALAVRRFTKTRVVISYYDEPIWQTLYLDHGFKKVVVTTKKVMKPTTEDNAPEILLILN